jgi:hypothetical protein
MLHYSSANTIQIPKSEINESAILALLLNFASLICIKTSHKPNLPYNLTDHPARTEWDSFVRRSRTKKEELSGG